MSLSYVSNVSPAPPLSLGSRFQRLRDSAKARAVCIGEPLSFDTGKCSIVTEGTYISGAAHDKRQN